MSKHAKSNSKENMDFFHRADEKIGVQASN